MSAWNGSDPPADHISLAAAIAIPRIPARKV